MLGIDAGFLGHPARKVVTTPTELSWVHVNETVWSVVWYGYHTKYSKC